jgi:hypothetical protein
MVSGLLGFSDLLTDLRFTLSVAGFEFAEFILRFSLNLDPRFFFWLVPFLVDSITGAGGELWLVSFLGESMIGAGGVLSSGESVFKHLGVRLPVAKIEEEQCTSSSEDRVPSSGICEILSET